MFEMLTLLMVFSAWSLVGVVNPLFTSLFLILFMIFSSFLLLLKKISWLFLATAIMFLGGMMVVFVYASSLSSSKKLILKYKLKNFIGSGLVLVSGLSIFSLEIFSNFQINISEMFKDSLFNLLILMALYLLLTLVILVKIVRWKEGPLKSQFK